MRFKYKVGEVKVGLPVFLYGREEDGKMLSTTPVVEVEYGDGYWEFKTKNGSIYRLSVV